MNATADLLDVNVWLAFAVEGHPHHAATIKVWGNLRQPTFCRATQMGFLRLLCNQHVMGEATLDPMTAWEKYQQLVDSGAVHFEDEPAGIEANLKSLLKNSKAARDFWTDVWLAAFAKTAGLRLVTFDAGFRRFKDLDCFILA